MKRDMELVRKIMFRLEELDGEEPFPSSTVAIPGSDQPTIDYHCNLLRDCGYVEADDDQCISGGSYFALDIVRLTSAGHDFIDSARNDTVWNKTIATAKEKGISLTIDLAMQLLKATTKSMLGI